MSDRRIELLLVDDHPIIRHGIRMAIGTVDDIEVTGEPLRARSFGSMPMYWRHSLPMLKKMRYRRPTTERNSSKNGINWCRTGLTTLSHS